ncbi:MAG TPA: pirin family protein [Gemmataceae bacterium]|nr:pirin family protein [Gemmataceae bacterium]
MITIRKSNDRGHTEIGWLDSRHTFSFGDYYDPRNVNFRSLRVINEDHIAPGSGFGMHGHRDMEIVTCMLAGTLQHKDSLGHGELLRPGEWQRMTAGTGVRHSEFNHSEKDPAHLLQIWLLPEKPALDPGYEQRSFADDKQKGLRLIVSPDARNGALKIHQDVQIYEGKLQPGESASHTLKPKRHAWVQVAAGEITLNGQALAAGDGAAVSDETTLAIVARQPAHVILFDLA